MRGVGTFKELNGKGFRNDKASEIKTLMFLRFDDKRETLKSAGISKIKVETVVE